ncbi:putative cell wall binding repeat protein [Clostridium saccharobutylicum]|uniref:lysozyme n=1 Tax=Clostridium saccharobutylicum TaxID=169679 RepID=UPI00098CE2D8|nr:lysozyme [Clostridium saccharobutylicum]OOM17233.1 putative cell wall binding repeat protein [Clostridium saccharobutylicum]
MSKWCWALEEDDKTLATGWNQVGDYWYLFDSNGAMKTGWYQDNNGKWYYLNDYTDDKFPQGAMVTGWKQINSKWYYFYKSTDASQAEYIGTTSYSCTKTIDGKDYSFDKDGVWIENTNILSDNGADFTGSWEGFWSQAQYDPYYPNDQRYITIGYGTTYSAMPSAFNSDNPLNTTCTIEQAREWLEKEAQTCAETIKSDLDSKGISLNQNQLDALISFAYNCGTGALLGSTLYKNIVAGVIDSDIITANFQAWSKANGVTSAGLLKRRNSEAQLYLNADYIGNN